MISRGFGTAAVLMLLVLALFTIARLIGGRGPGNLSKRQQRARVARSARDMVRVEGSYERRAAAGRAPQPSLIPGLDDSWSGS